MTSNAQLSLQAKIEVFQKTLSENELLRLNQLRSVDGKGNLLFGQASCDAASGRLADKEELSRELRDAVNASLRQKLTLFEASLDQAELTELLVQLSGNSYKHQSSFGTRCS